MMPDPRLNGQMYVYKALSGPVEKAKSYDPKREFKVGYSTWIEFFLFLQFTSGQQERRRWSHADLDERPRGDVGALFIYVFLNL